MMSKHAIEDRVLKISVGLKLEAGTIKPVHVRALLNGLGFLELGDIPQDRRAQFLVALDTVSGSIAVRA